MPMIKAKSLFSGRMLNWCSAIITTSLLAFIALLKFSISGYWELKYIFWDVSYRIFGLRGENFDFGNALK